MTKRLARKAFYFSCFIFIQFYLVFPTALSCRRAEAEALGPFSCKAATLPFPAGGRLLCPLRFSVSGFSRVRLRRSLPVRSGLLSRPRPWLWSFGAPTRHPPCTPPRADLLNSARAAPATTTHRRPPPAAWALSNFGFAPHDQKIRSHSQLPAALHSLATVQAPKAHSRSTDLSPPMLRPLFTTNSLLKLSNDFTTDLGSRAPEPHFTPSAATLSQRHRPRHRIASHRIAPHRTASLLLQPSQA